MAPNIKRFTSIPCDDDDAVFLADREEEQSLNNKSSHSFDVGELSDNNDEDTTWICPASAKSQRTTNPIRLIVDPIVAETLKAGARDDGKEQISLALGDPTANGNLPPCKVALESIMKALQSPNHAAGYVNACGTNEARTAIARYHSHDEVGLVSPDQVIVASGCSGALELALTSLLDPGSVLLVPKPGFPLYEVICRSHGAIVEYYDLLPDAGWECDLDDIDSILKKYEQHCDDDSNSVVRGIVINNPSNPTGSVYSEEHLVDILKLARRYRIPIVSDEVYGDLTIGEENKFHPLGLVAAKKGRHVPIVTVSGLGKQYLVPGWRVGWIVFHDNIHKSLSKVEAGSKRLAQVILGTSNLCQQIIPDLLTPELNSKSSIEISKWKTSLRSALKEQAMVVYNELSKINNKFTFLKDRQLISVIKPQGAMYAMVKIDISLFDNAIQNDIDLTKLLLKEENVFVLPGSAFGMGNRTTPALNSNNTDNQEGQGSENEVSLSTATLSLASYAFFRVVFCAPKDTLLEATKRITNFCDRHCTTTIFGEETEP